MSQLLARFAARSDDPRTGVFDDAGTHTYVSIVQRAVAVSAALSATASLQPGERVALLGHPSADFISAFFGVLLAGGCVVVLSPLHPPPETRYFCADAGVRTVLVSAPLRD